MGNRELFYTHFDLSKYRNIEKTELDKMTLVILVKSTKFAYNNGIMRYFFSFDNKMPLSIPGYFIQWKGQVTTTLAYPLADLLQTDDLYLTVLNDYGIDVSFSVNWTVKKSAVSVKSDENMLNIDGSSDEPSSFKQSKTFKILMLALIVAGAVAIISILVFFVVRTVRKNNASRKHDNNDYKLYTDA